MTRFRLLFTALLALAAILAPGPVAQAQQKKKTPAKTQQRTVPKKKTPAKKKPAARPKPAVKPRPAQPKPVPASLPDWIVVSKTGYTAEELIPPPEPEKRRWFRRSQYKYLTPAVRDAIDRANVSRYRWRYIVIHNSGTRQGNAKAFDYYHRRVRKMPNGLAYHFVIGNGRSSGNGQIEIGQRWNRQVSGGHVHSDYLNSISIGICLVGDFNQDKPTARQLEALEELVTYLRKRVGPTDGKVAVVKPHKLVNPPRRPTDCPGNRFPYPWLRSKFD